MKKIIVSLLALSFVSSFAAPASWNIKRICGWTPEIDGLLSEWPGACLIDSIRSDTNVYYRTSTLPWARSEIQFLVYAAYDDNKVYFAVKVVADNSIRMGNWMTGDNIRVNQGGAATGFYVGIDGYAYREASCPFTLNSTLFTARSMAWNPPFPTYEFSASRSVLDPFNTGRFQLSVGSEDRDADSSACYLAIGAAYTGSKQDNLGKPWNNPMYYPTFYLIADSTCSGPADQATHVFWRNAARNRYNMAEKAPGSGLAGSVVLHEGMVATGTVQQSSGSQGDNFAFGSGLDDVQGRCAFIWSEDLNSMTGTVLSARVRGEYRDGWSGNALCNAGPIAVRCGVVDYTGNISVWGGVGYVPCNATWQDFLNPLGSTMGFDLYSPDLQAEEIINVSAPPGRASAGSPSILDGRFFEIDVTDQVKWILANPGQHAIVFLVAPGQGSTGKISLYADECGSGSQMALGSDKPWTLDGNSVHIVATGAMTYSVGHPLAMGRDTSTASTAYLHLSDTVADGITFVTSSAGETLAGHIKLVGLNLNWSAALDAYIDSARLVIPYKDSMVSWLMRPENTLEIRYYNGSGWQTLPCVLDTVHNRVSATITANGIYALFVDPPPTDVFRGLPARGVAINRVRPNPFNQTTVIDYFQNGCQDVKINIFDARGSLVKTLVNKTLQPGPYRASWNGLDNSERPLSSGIYLLRVQSGNDRMNKKIHLIR